MSDDSPRSDTFLQRLISLLDMVNTSKLSLGAKNAIAGTLAHVAEVQEL